MVEEDLMEKLRKVEWNKDFKWVDANEYRYDMCACFHDWETDIEKLKVIVETMENESLTDTEWGAVCDLMKEGATFETAKNTFIDAK